MGLLDNLWAMVDLFWNAFDHFRPLLDNFGPLWCVCVCGGGGHFGFPGAVFGFPGRCWGFRAGFWAVFSRLWGNMVKAGPTKGQNPPAIVNTWSKMVTNGPKLSKHGPNNSVPPPPPGHPLKTLLEPHYRAPIVQTTWTDPNEALCERAKGRCQCWRSRAAPDLRPCEGYPRKACTGSHRPHVGGAAPGVQAARRSTSTWRKCGPGRTCRRHR